MKEYYLHLVDGMWQVTDEVTDNRLTCEEGQIAQALDAINRALNIEDEDER